MLAFKKSKPRGGQRTRERDADEADESLSESASAIASKVKSKAKRSKAKSKLSFGADEVGVQHCYGVLLTVFPRTMRERRSR